MCNVIVLCILPLISYNMNGLKNPATAHMQKISEICIKN